MGNGGLDERRIIAGRISSGRLRTGDRLLFSPSNKTATVTSIEAWQAPGPVLEATAGQSIGLTLDEPVFVERGELISHEADPPIETDVFEARLFWLAEWPLEAGQSVALRLGHQEVVARVEAITGVIDIDTQTRLGASAVARDQIADVVVRCRRPVALDEHGDLAATGRVVLLADGVTVAGGLVSMGTYPDQRALEPVRATNVAAVAHGVADAHRQARNDHAPGVLWLTGLSGAGKSTLAMAVERRLFEAGYQVYVLDGDNVRRGLNANLGFAPEGRAENIRRVGEVASLFAGAGMIVVTAFISPYRADRARARRAAGAHFHEVFVKADLAVCEARDPKGLYARARRGEIKDFTGISAPYEEPEAPDLVVDTAALDIAAATERIIDYVRRTFGAPAR